MCKTQFRLSVGCTPAAHRQFSDAPPERESRNQASHPGEDTIKTEVGVMPAVIHGD